MPNKDIEIEISLSVTYKLRGKLLAEYLEWLDGYSNTPYARKSFLIDRFVGEHNLDLFDPKAKLSVKETTTNA
jgi:hypothetical protein